MGLYRDYIWVRGITKRIYNQVGNKMEDETETVIVQGLGIIIAKCLDPRLLV